MVALEQQQAEEKKERLQANEQRRADLLAARNAALEQRKRELSQRATQRSKVTQEKAEHMRKLHEEVCVWVFVAGLRGGWVGGWVGGLHVPLPCLFVCVLLSL